MNTCLTLKAFHYWIAMPVEGQRVPLPWVNALPAPGTIVLPSRKQGTHRGQIGTKLLAALAAAVLVLAASGARAAGDATVPLIRTGFNHFGIRVSINGHPSVLLLDTGAPVTTLDAHVYDQYATKDAASQLPDNVQRLSSLNNQAAKTGYIADLAAGSMHFGGGPVAVTDMHRVNGNTSHNPKDIVTDGVLGADILTKYGAVIDWSRRVVYFYADPAQRTSIGRAATANGWTAIPMQFTNGRHFAVPCTLGNTNYQLIVDTGAPYTMIDQSVFGGHDPTRSGPHTYASGINGILEVRPTVLKSWSIGTFAVQNTAVGIVKLDKALTDETTKSPTRTIGLLGSEWLAHRAGIIDVNGMTLYLKSPSKAKG